jgi:hypothetical protein
MIVKVHSRISCHKLRFRKGEIKEVSREITDMGFKCKFRQEVLERNFMRLILIKSSKEREVSLKS